jgi:uncharacterized protein YecE (DUF72 family)
LTPENASALREFLPQLPRDIRFSVEFRASEWMKQSVAEMLARYNVALALVEGQWVERREMWQVALKCPAADFSYVRWMGARDLARFDRVRRAQDENLREWGDVIAGLQERAAVVYAYFSNFYEGHAPASANKLKRLLGQPVVEATDLEDQPSLF